MDILTVVENIQRICKEKGTTPTVACKESGAGKDMVTNMKKRGTQPSIEKIRLLAGYLDVTTDELLVEKAYLSHFSDDELSQESREIAIAYKQATEKEQKMVRLILSDYLHKLKAPFVTADRKVSKLNQEDFPNHSPKSPY